MVIALHVFLERMSGLLPAEKKQVLLNALSQRESFKILYHLNLDNHCGDFQEDFRLPEAECGIQRQISAQEEKALKAGKMALEAATVTTAAAKSAEELGVETKASTVRKALTLAALAAVASAAITALFSSLAAAYHYGRNVYGHSWTNKANKGAFKCQFVAHVTKKQQLIVDSTSADCSNQVEQASSTLAQLCHLVNDARNDMDAEIETLAKEIKQMEEAANSAEVLHDKANYITKILKLFDRSFFKPP